MNIYITRHGQTNYNKAKVMQGLYDEPLNEAGILQAKDKSKIIENIKFDAVYASPLKRAIQTASIISNTDEKDILIDSRIIEVDFGKYELCPFSKLGLKMTLYWILPELFKAPDTVETTKSMILRSESFLKELESKDYENVLIVCHGGIIRTLRGYLEDKRNGLKWRPKPKNAQIYVYQSIQGKHKFIKTI